eukprot:scpid87548/ scgid28770/ 
MSLSSGTVPACFNLPYVSPLFRSGDTAVVGNYRPVSLLPIVSRLLEHCVKKQIMAFGKKEMKKIMEKVNKDGGPFKCMKMVPPKCRRLMFVKKEKTCDCFAELIDDEEDELSQALESCAAPVSDPVDKAMVDTATETAPDTADEETMEEAEQILDDFKDHLEEMFGRMEGMCRMRKTVSKGRRHGHRRGGKRHGG